jgi:hypothetical protein
LGRWIPLSRLSSLHHGLRASRRAPVEVPPVAAPSDWGTPQHEEVFDSIKKIPHPEEAA